MRSRLDGDVWIFEQQEEWACHVQASIRCDEGSLVSGLTDTAENVIAPAAVGAGLGAAGAAITGGDPGMGALIGGGTGAVSGGLNWATGGANPVTSIFGGGGGGTDTSTSTAVASDLGLQPNVSAMTAPAGGTSAAAISAPSGVDGMGGGGGVDLTQPDPNAGTSGGAVPFGSDQVPQQSIMGKPDIPGNQATPPGGGSSVMNAINDPSGTNILKAVGSNLGPLVAGGGLLANLIRPQSGVGVSSTNALANQANALNAQGGQLESYLMNGTLPPGAQNAIDLGTKSAKAHIRAQYAARGMSGSSAEVADLNNVDNVARTQAFDYANKLLQTGIDETGLSSKIYEALIGIDEKQSAAMGDAIANFSAALAGGVPVKRAA